MVMYLLVLLKQTERGSLREVKTTPSEIQQMGKFKDLCLLHSRLSLNSHKHLSTGQLQ